MTVYLYFRLVYYSLMMFHDHHIIYNNVSLLISMHPFFTTEPLAFVVTGASATWPMENASNEKRKKKALTSSGEKNMLRAKVVIDNIFVNIFMPSQITQKAI